MNRAARSRVVFIGQSLNLVPFGSTYPDQLMASFPKVPYTNSAVGGAAWNGLTKVREFQVKPWATRAAVSILIMNGGTTDIAVGATGADTYAAMGSYATWATSNGYDYVIGTTITPDTAFSGPQETERLACNTAIMADASNYFDAQVDFMTDSRLTDAADTTYYTGGIHWTAAGAGVAASVMKPTLASVLAAHL